MLNLLVVQTAVSQGVMGITKSIYKGYIGEYPIEMTIYYYYRADGIFVTGYYKYTRVGQEIDLAIQPFYPDPLINPYYQGGSSMDDLQNYYDTEGYDVVSGNRIRVKEYLNKKHTGTFYFDGEGIGKEKHTGYWHSVDNSRIYRFEIYLFSSVCVKGCDY
ncbi:MAG: hypothetical protein NZ455_04180 [Bacteroidia bacterium]|nr:hypothetical protein [Bacteroidia bacterium]